ncbi:MAG: translation initiation factor IF-2 subunit gamma, partial [Acidilobaceae archaeon]
TLPGAKENIKVDDIRKNETLVLSVGPAITVGTVTTARKEYIELNVKRPVVAEKGFRVAISRRVAGRWRLIGWGIVES